jgi:hypothetical protein
MVILFYPLTNTAQSHPIFLTFVEFYENFYRPSSKIEQGDNLEAAKVGYFSEIEYARGGERSKRRQN